MITRVRKEYTIPLHEFSRLVGIGNKIVRVSLDRDFNVIRIEEEVKEK